LSNRFLYSVDNLYGKFENGFPDFLLLDFFHGWAPRPTRIILTRSETNDGDGNNQFIVPNLRAAKRPKMYCRYLTS
jgi:hypothetical protein